MFVGIFVNGMETYYKWFTPEGCQVDERMVFAVHVMYATYLYLFVEVSGSCDDHGESGFSPSYISCESFPLLKSHYGRRAFLRLLLLQSYDHYLA